MRTLNFETGAGVQAGTIRTECHSEGYEDYFNGETCPYENHQDEKVSWEAGFRHARMDDLGE